MMNAYEVMQRGREALKQATAEAIRLQDECPHPLEQVIEGRYREGILNTYAPFRVCRACGYAEEGWYYGYDLMHQNVHPIPELPRDEAMKYVLLEVLSHEHPRRKAIFDRLRRERWAKTKKSHEEP